MQSVNQKITMPADGEMISLPTWEAHVLIPVTQNILGGIAVGALGFIGVIAYTGTVENAIDLYNAGVWCGLAGGIVTCAVTIIRFFGDDLGVVTTAYKAGYHARDSQVAALELELRASYDAQSSADANGNARSVISERQRMMDQARKDAAKIVEVAFAGDNTSRDAMKGRGMGQRNWERAVRLLMASGAMNGDGIIVATSPAQALKAIDEQLSADNERGDKFTTKWQ